MEVLCWISRLDVFSSMVVFFHFLYTCRRAHVIVVVSIEPTIVLGEGLLIPDGIIDEIFFCRFSLLTSVIGWHQEMLETAIVVEGAYVV